MKELLCENIIIGHGDSKILLDDIIWYNIHKQYVMQS